MKFRNPWIDPRITQVTPEGIQTYLLQHGWKNLGPASNPYLLRFEVEDGNEEAPTLFVPVLVDEGPALQWLIECIADLALWQGRWAVDVLNEILRQSPAEVAPTNGPAVSLPAEPAPK
jgi:hypothetical protein